MIELTPAGLTTQTTAEILAETMESIRSVLGTNLGSRVEHVIYVFAAVMAERESLAHQAILASHGSQDPDAAEDAALDAICALSGTLREVDSESTVTLTCTGTNGTALTAGRRVAVDDTEEVFVTTALATLATLTAWAIATAYVVGNRRTNAGRSYICITAGTSAGAGGPTTTSEDITDGTAHWRYMGEGAAAVDVAAEAEETGPIQAISGTITTISTPVSGWSSVINLLDATPGTAREGNAPLRVRRELELWTGAGVLGAIRRAVLSVDGVTAAEVFQNTSSATVDSIPPHAVEAVVVGGEDQDIWDAVFALGTAAGIRPYGNTSGSATDSRGGSHTVAFSRPVEVDVYVTASIIKDPSTFPVNGDELVEAAIVAAGDLYAVGKDLSASAVVAMIFGACAGVLDVPTVYIGTAPSPVTSTTIAISKRQVAVFDTSRINLTLTNGVP